MNLIFNSLFSRYRPGYITTLVYMLQGSEYRLAEYLPWLHRTRDFSKVEQRKRLRLTAKAKLLFGTLWLLVIVLVGLAVVLAIYGWWIWGLVVVVATPWMLPYLVLVPLGIGYVAVQRPQERRLNRRTAATLRAVSAYKIAVAGSYGKTTMKELLTTVLSGTQRVAATPGNYNTPIGISRFVATLAGNEDVLIFELGEYHPGDITELCGIVQPDLGVITGVNEAHLEKFKTLERTVATIFELADYLGDRPLYVNAESVPAAARTATNSTRYSLDGAGEWRVDAKSVKVGLDGTKFTARKGTARVRARSHLLGAHQVGPLTAVIAIADQLGLSTQRIEAGIAQTRPFEHRLEPKPLRDGVVLIDDTYNGNPDGARVAIEFLGGLQGHRRVYVTPGLVEMGSRTAQVHQEIGRQLAGAVEVVVLVRNSVSGYIEQGLTESGFSGEIRYFATSLEAVQAVPSLSKAGDVVLLQNDWGDNYA